MKLVVFDVDGTLVDSQIAIVAAMGAGFNAADLPAPTREQVLAIVGLSLPVAVAVLAPDATPAQHERIVAGYREAAIRTRGETQSPLYPGARECLEALAGREGVLLAIATGKARRGLDALIDVQGWRGVFVSLQTADFHPSKPHPAMLQAALDEAGVRPQRAAMVGDTEFDIAMGVAAGTRALGVGWGYHPRDRLLAAGASLVAPDYPALTRALLGWIDE